MIGIRQFARKKTLLRAHPNISYYKHNIQKPLYIMQKKKKNKQLTFL